MKFRVIVDGVSFYSNSSSIKSGVGDFTTVNRAVLYAYNTLMNDRKVAKANKEDLPVGFATTVDDRQVQINIL